MKPPLLGSPSIRIEFPHRLPDLKCNWMVTSTYKIFRRKSRGPLRSTPWFFNICSCTVWRHTRTAKICSQKLFFECIYQNLALSKLLVIERHVSSCKSLQKYVLYHRDADLTYLALEALFQGAIQKDKSRLTLPTALFAMQKPVPLRTCRKKTLTGFYFHLLLSHAMKT